MPSTGSDFFTNLRHRSFFYSQVRVIQGAALSHTPRGFHHSRVIIRTMTQPLSKIIGMLVVTVPLGLLFYVLKTSYILEKRSESYSRQSMGSSLPSESSADAKHDCGID